MVAKKLGQYLMQLCCFKTSLSKTFFLTALLLQLKCGCRIIQRQLRVQRELSKIHTFCSFSSLIIRIIRRMKVHLMIYESVHSDRSQHTAARSRVVVNSHGHEFSVASPSTAGHAQGECPIRDHFHYAWIQTRKILNRPQGVCNPIVASTDSGSASLVPSPLAVPQYGAMNVHRHPTMRGSIVSDIFLEPPPLPPPLSWYFFGDRWTQVRLALLVATASPSQTKRWWHYSSGLMNQVASSATHEVA